MSLSNTEKRTMSDNSQAAVPIGATSIFNGYIDEPDYCRQRGISLRTAQRDRQLRQSPPYHVVGRRVLYRVAAVQDWLLEQERRTERKPLTQRGGGRR